MVASTDCWKRNAISGGNTLGPLICGFIVTKLSWRWHKWIAVILTAINFIAVLFFVPETRYDREAAKTAEIARIPSDFDIGDDKELTKADIKPIRRPSDEPIQQVPKKTFVQELSLWSGTPSTNLFKMVLRYGRARLNTEQETDK